MNIKSILLGSAAALAAVSGAQAADAIVAAEPEAMEYVRVCDAFGTGYFYIPGTETCLQLKGYVRTELRYRQDGYTRPGAGTTTITNGDYDGWSRAQVQVNAKNDTEYGTLSSYIVLQAETGRGASTDGAYIDAAYINIAGFDVGNYYTWWDEDLSGETDVLSDNDTTLNGIRYTYDGGAFKLGVAVEELIYSGARDANKNVGLGGLIGGTLGGVTATLIGNYDANREEAVFRGIVSADIGPGTLSVAAIYGTDKTYYWQTSEWTVAAEYAFKVSDKLTITPAAQFFSDVDFKSGDAWKAGATVSYNITDGLQTKVTLNYVDADKAGTSLTSNGKKDQWTGFARVQRDF
jgi:hypothetical protein